MKFWQNANFYNLSPPLYYILSFNTTENLADNKPMFTLFIYVKFLNSTILMHRKILVEKKLLRSCLPEEEYKQKLVKNNQGGDLFGGHIEF